MTLPINAPPSDSATAEHLLTTLYQPRISAQSHSVSGFASLLSWRSATNHCARPEPVDTEHLWTWKLKNLHAAACLLTKFCQRSQKPQAGVYLSLNLLSTQLMSDRWAVHLLQMIDAGLLSGGRVALHIRGRCCELNASFVECTFDRIRESGATLTLCDFPRGASLALLTQVRFEKVRIDRSILPSMSDPISTWKKKKELLKGMIAGIRDIGAEVILDGIDTPMHFYFFHDLPATEWQGNYWGQASELACILAAGQSLPWE